MHDRLVDDALAAATAAADELERRLRALDPAEETARRIMAANDSRRTDP